MSRDLFKWSKIATAYAKYRPTYGKEVFDTIINFCKETNDSLSLAIDVGCGSGQSTIPLAKDFDKVIGIDVSVKQIENAPENLPNVSFRTGLAEDLSFLSDGTVDLVTVAQTLHWLDLKAFFGEVQRILKPGGSLVVYGYGLAVLDNSKALEVQNYVRTYVTYDLNRRSPALFNKCVSPKLGGACFSNVTLQGILILMDAKY